MKTDDQDLFAEHRPKDPYCNCRGCFYRRSLAEVARRAARRVSEGAPVEHYQEGVSIYALGFFSSLDSFVDRCRAWRLAVPRYVPGLVWRSVRLDVDRILTLALHNLYYPAESPSIVESGSATTSRYPTEDNPIWPGAAVKKFRGAVEEFNDTLAALGPTRPDEGPTVVELPEGVWERDYGA